MKLLLLTCLAGLFGVGVLQAVEDKADIADLVKNLQSEDLEVRNKAAAALLAKKTEAVPALMNVVEKGKDKERGRALAILAKIGPDAVEAVPSLQKLIDDDPQAKKLATLRAIQVLGRIGPKAKDAVPTLRKALQNKEPRSPLRIEAAMALGRIGPDAKEATPDLIAALKEPTDKSGPLRFHAATALGQIGPAAKAAVPALVELLKDEKVGPARLVAAQALGGIGPDAKDAIAALKEAADSKQTALATAAVKALKGIQREK